MQIEIEEFHPILFRSETEALVEPSNLDQDLLKLIDHSEK